VTSINMKISHDIDDSLRYFAGGPRHSWTGKVLKLQMFVALLISPIKWYTWVVSISGLSWVIVLF